MYQQGLRLGVEGGLCLTNGLNEQSQRVQKEEGHVQEVEASLDTCKDRRVLLES